MNDVLHDALRDATLAALLGSTEVMQQTIDPNGGMPMMGTITIPSAFLSRIQQQAYKGDYDALISAALAKITPEDLAETLKTALAEQMIRGLESVSSGFGNTPKPGWLQVRARDLAVEACTAALKDDEELIDTLRARIGAEVDRHRVGINVSLSDPETV